MTSPVWDTITGGQSLIEWFGRIPRFHDAEVVDISIAAKTPTIIRIRAWIMTDRVDDRGYFVLDPARDRDRFSGSGYRHRTD